MTDIENRFERLRAYISSRAGKPLSGKDLAELLGVSAPLINQIERGARTPSSRIAIKLQKLYGIDPDWYLSGLGAAPWEIETARPNFDLNIVRKHREKGLYPVKPEDRKRESINAISDILDWTKFEEILDYIIEAGRNLRFRSTLYNVLEGGLEQLIYDLSEAQKIIDTLKLKVERGQDQLIERDKKIKELNEELQELRQARQKIKKPESQQ